MSGESEAFKPLVIHFHSSFADGDMDEDFLVDLPQMTDAEADRLADWIHDILEGKPHKGRNKPSSKRNSDDSLQPGSYRDNDVWHYHCGPRFKRRSGWAMTPADLRHNEAGQTSAQCYHYSKLKKPMLGLPRDLTILGYSCDHEPFLEDTDPSNPLRKRGGKQRESTPVEDYGFGGARLPDPPDPPEAEAAGG